MFYGLNCLYWTLDYVEVGAWFLDPEFTIDTPKWQQQTTVSLVYIDHFHIIDVQAYISLYIN